MSKKRVLIVDDEAATRSALFQLFAQMGLAADSVSGGVEGLARATADGYDLVILDSGLPDHDCKQILEEIRRERPELPVILISCTSVSSALEAVRLGAYDYVAKPLELDELRIVAERALERRRLIEENRRLTKLLERELSPERSLRDMEKSHVQRVLAHNNWNQSKSALVLGIDRKTLRKKILEFKLKKPEPK